MPVTHDADRRPWAEPWGIVFALAALGNLGNAAWMLADPVHWYLNLPANVPGSGPLNEHFVRDIGCIFGLIGSALAIGVFKPAARFSALLVASGFYGAHTAVHIFDTARGLMEPAQWKIDAIPVYATTLLLVGLTVLMARTRREPGWRPE